MWNIADSIDVVITTVPRPAEYVHDLVSSLSPLPVHLVAGAVECDYLKRHEGNYRIRIVPPKPADWERIRTKGVHHRACWNYWRCLVTPARASTRKGLLVLEDDVRPAQGWDSLLQLTIAEVEARIGGAGYVLALYVPIRCLPISSIPAAHYTKYPVRRFFGTQAMYFPERVSRGFAQFLKSNGVDRFRRPYDLLLREFVLNTGLQLLATVPSLFQHVGRVSTGLGGFHQSPYFREVATENLIS